jgi:O-antigen/teichoic acid export membrane protein
MNKILVLATTAMPGLQRLLMFIFLERLLSMEQLGYFASDFSLLQIISFFSAIGWSGLVLTRVPKLTDTDSEIYLLNILTMAILYCLGYALIIILLFYAGLLFDLYGSIFFMISWMFYQIVRHYRLAKRGYRLIISADLSALLLFILLVSFGIGALLAASVSYLIATLILFIKTSPFKEQLKNLSKEDHVKSFQISMSNFLSSGIFLGLPFIVTLGDDEKYSALLGYLLSVIVMAQLIPRGLSLYLTPKIAELNHTKKSVTILIKYIGLNSLLTIAMFFVQVSLYYISVSVFDIKIFELENSANIGLSLLLVISIGSLTLPASTYLLAHERTNDLLFSSFINLMISVIGVYLYYLFDLSIVYLILSMAFAMSIKTIISYCQVQVLRSNDWQ